jgi:hypothetical protein
VLDLDERAGLGAAGLEQPTLTLMTCGWPSQTGSKKPNPDA